MKKTYIIKNASRILAEQIEYQGILERDAMNNNPIINTKGLSAVIPGNNDGYCTVYKMDCAKELYGNNLNVLLVYFNHCTGQKAST